MTKNENEEEQLQFRFEYKTPEQVSVAVDEFSKKATDFIHSSAREFMKKGFLPEILYDVAVAGIAIALKEMSGTQRVWEDFQRIEGYIFRKSEIAKDMSQEGKFDLIKKLYPEGPTFCDDPDCLSCNMLRKIFSEMPFGSSETKH